MIPQIGDPVPHFEGMLHTGELITNKSILGQKCILFFYSNDDSSSCQNEILSVKDSFRDISDSGYLIYGISSNTAKKHSRFIDRLAIPFPLVADIDRAMIQAFHLWGHKKFMGRDIIGVYRTTFLVNKNGTIVERIDKVRAKSHGIQILQSIIQIESELV